MIQMAGVGHDARSGHSSVRPPRAVAWTVLAASAGAIVSAGVAATIAMIADGGLRLSDAPLRFWAAWLGAAAATIVSLVIRAQRWAFLLRRSGTRIPIRDAVIGYCSGLALLAAPLLVGEIAVRCYVLHARAGVRPATTVLVNMWERLLDVIALGLIVCAAAIASGSLTPALSAAAIAVIIAAAVRSDRVWLAATAASVAAWALPGFALWTLARAWTPAIGLLHAEQMFAAASLNAALRLAPGGIVMVGRALIGELTRGGLGAGEAVLTVFAIRIATAGIATALGVVFVAGHFRTRRTTGAHFEEIASAYDAQIPEARRVALLDKKSALMASAIDTAGVGRRGLDVGCGQGWYLARMRELGFDVHGIDTARGQLSAAARFLGDASLVGFGSVLDIPAADASYDFVYTINVVHHLASVDEQRRAFAELLRVLKPGGLLLLHEINTRNLLFRFYMGYVFPTLNCIDEGVERWLLPTRLPLYASLPVRDIAYFTFVPEFVPPVVVRVLRPIERLLERSPLRIYSAHYMAVFQKPA